MNEITDYLKHKHIPFKLEGKEAVIKCPHCNHDKLYINIESSLFHCFHCEAVEPDSKFAKGHLSYLKTIYGDVLPTPKIASSHEDDVDFTDMVGRYNYELKQNKDALRYLIKRGISQDSIDRFKLGFTKRYNQEWISIPSFEDGVPKLLKLRKLPPDTAPELGKYIREKGSKSILFNGDILADHEELILVEGELDAITLLQNGYDNVVGITGGAGTLKPEWYDDLILKPKLITVLDPDDAGQKAAKSVWATRLGLDKVWNVVLPADEDINSFFNKYSKEDFDGILSQAARWTVDGVVNIKEALIDLYQDSQTKDDVYPTPFEKLNKLLPHGGLRKSHLVTIGAPSGTGKTTMAIQLCYYITKYYELPSLVICLEMPAKELATKVVQLDRDFYYSQINPEDGLVYATDMEDLDMYFSYTSSLSLDVLTETVKVCRDRFGIGIIVLDNLQLMVRDMEHISYALVSQRAKQLALELDLIFVLISQPRKLLSGQVMSQEDLYGTSSIKADSDEVLILNRKKSGKDGEVLSTLTLCSLEKNRYGRSGKFYLELIGEKSKFVACEPPAKN